MDWKDIIDFDLSESELEEYLKSTPSYLLLGDGATLKLENKSKLHLQIANLNFSKYNIYPYTPFVGYKGTLYIIQSLLELEKANSLI